MSTGPIWTRSRIGRSASAADGSSSSARRSGARSWWPGSSTVRRRSGTSPGSSSGASACASWAARSRAGRRATSASTSRPALRARMRSRALLPFVFHELGCLHLELADPLLTRADVERFGFDVRVGHDVRVRRSTRTRMRLFARMESSTRRAIRKAEKCGVTVEEASPEGFAGRVLRPPRRRLRQAAAAPDLRPGARRAADPERASERRPAAAPGARPRRPQHRERDLPGLQPPLVLLGQREPPRAPDPAPQRGHPLVRDALLARARHGRTTTGAAAATTSRSTAATRVETLHFRRLARTRRSASRATSPAPRTTCRGGSSASATSSGSTRRARCTDTPHGPASGRWRACARHESNVRPQPPQGCALSPELRAPCGHSTSVPSRDALAAGVERDQRGAVLDRPAHVAERRSSALGQARAARDAADLALAVEQRRGQRRAPRRGAAGAARDWRGRGARGARSAPGRRSSPS